MPFMYIQGRVDVRTYKELCKNNGYDSEEKKCIFIFPGNSSHHALGTTLFSIKSGGGLAAASAAIGTAGYPTLSLPTTSMEEWSTNSRQQQIVRGALVDLYKAVGAGYQLILPVREHHDTRYFDHPLDADLQLELSFWGGIQAAANKPLANHYIKELHALSLFMSLLPEEQDKLARAEPDNPFYQAYVQGRTMALDDPWLTPKSGVKKVPAAKEPATTVHARTTIVDKPLLPPKVAVKKEPEAKEPAVHVHARTTTVDELPPTSAAKEKLAEERKSAAHAKPYIAPSSRACYEKYYAHSQDALSNARDLLDNYTAHNSMLLRFFTGHWNRHHVVAVNKLVEQIDKKQITDVADLVKQLKEIKLVNLNGSLARRICFIEEKNPAKPNPDEASTPSVTL